MNVISAQSVAEASRSIAVMEASGIGGLVDRMSAQQPVLLAYVLAVGEDYYTDEERQLLLFLSVAIWQVVSNADPAAPSIDGAALDDAERVNIEMLKYLQGDAPADFVESVDLILRNYSQPDVLKYVVEVLMDSEEWSGVIREESRGMLLLDVKTVVDAFDRALRAAHAPTPASGGSARDDLL